MLDEVIEHYESGAERTRLDGWGRLEFLRNLELLGRYLPISPALIADIGGGPGTYALPLSEAGHTVHLIDPAELHIEQATALRPALASVQRGEAQALPWADSSFDCALLFGPLYHLTDHRERSRALEEVARILVPGGLLLAMAISRFASVRDGIDRRFLADPGFREMLGRELSDGQHRNPEGHPWGFTSAYFHRPEEFEEEIREAGFLVDVLVAVEGPAGRLGNLDWWFATEERLAALLEVTRRVESERSLLGVSPQILAVCRKPG